jgi:hypothetical protein
VATAMTREVLEKARVAVLSPDDPPEFARRLRELQRADLTSNELEESSGRSTTISNLRTDKVIQGETPGCDLLHLVLYIG